MVRFAAGCFNHSKYSAPTARFSNVEASMTGGVAISARPGGNPIAPVVSQGTGVDCRSSKPQSVGWPSHLGHGPPSTSVGGVGSAIPVVGTPRFIATDDVQCASGWQMPELAKSDKRRQVSGISPHFVSYRWRPENVLQDVAPVQTLSILLFP